jgi:hypothetical protein
MLNVVYAECRKQTHYAKFHYAEFRYVECHYAECQYPECRYAECRGAAGNVGNACSGAPIK